MEEKIFPKGIFYNTPHENAPDFIKANITITIRDLNEFVNGHPKLLSEYQGKKQLKLDLKESKGGKLYLDINTYKPENKQTTQTTSNEDVIDPNDLPF